MTKSTGNVSINIPYLLMIRASRMACVQNSGTAFSWTAFFVAECRRQSYTAARRENAWQKNVRAKAHLCMHRPYPSLSTTWNNMQIGASTSIILFIVFTHFQLDFSYNSGSKQLINTTGLLDFVSHQHHVFIFWKGWWNTNSIRKTLLARASVSCSTTAMYCGCFVSVA